MFEEVAFEETMEKVASRYLALRSALELLGFGLSIFINDIFKELFEVVLVVHVDLKEVFYHYLLLTSDLKLVFFSHSFSVVRVAFDVNDSVNDLLGSVKETFS
jgi:hypothetical protein